jgi:NAD(P)-dependent dehydrogenase (short-subunit alcohol dehydrogenase family)
MDPSVSKELSGKVALVTGGTRGLGREIAFGLARAGASVVVASRKADACTQVAAEIAEATGVATLGQPCHVGKWPEVGDLVEAVYERFGQLDVLVNNAGMSPLYGSLGALSEELFDKTLAVNLKGPFRLATLAGERMAQADGGSIINISSTGAVKPDPISLPYAVAKAGLNAATLGMARAFGPKVRVNAIMPGPFLTDVSESWDMPAMQAWVDTFALRRFGQPGEIVGAVLYFASDWSSYTTGAILSIHGGET